MDTSGSATVVSSVASTALAKAASSMPAPMQVPCRWVVTRGAICLSHHPALRWVRMPWAVAGSVRVPNSARSPPLQKI